MHDVFISYKSEEYDDALWIRETLEENGFSCWMAPKNIPGGSSYAEEIPTAIQGCKVFVLVLSTRAQVSRWVKRELDTALNAGKIVLPFMLERFELNRDMNFYLGIVQRYDASENRMDAMEKMLRELRALIGITEELEKRAKENAQEEDGQPSLPPNPEKARKMQELLDRCEAGVVPTPNSMFELGSAYEMGDGLPRSMEKAMYWYESAANHLHTDAQYRLALCYLAGERKSKGVQRLAQAALLGHVEAMYRLGMCYLDGIGVNESEEQAIEQLSRAGECGHQRAAFRLGQLYENKLRDVFGWSAMTEKKEDHQKCAINWYRRAAENEDPESYFRLGRLLKKARERDEAMNMFRQAAEQGHALAQMEMAQLFFEGNKPEKAVSWLDKAAARGLPDAQYRLSCCYRDGEGVVANVDIAFHWLKQAAEGGYGNAQYDLALQLFAAKEDSEAALRFLNMAAMKGYQEAVCALAICQYYGSGVAKDPFGAMERLRNNREHQESQYLWAVWTLKAGMQDWYYAAVSALEKLCNADRYVPAMTVLAKVNEKEGRITEAIHWYGAAAIVGEFEAVEAFHALRKVHRLRWFFSFYLRKSLREKRDEFYFREPRVFDPVLKQWWQLCKRVL